MTRSCYHPTRGYCFCEFCIAAYLKNAYVQANNSPKEPIDFKNFKKSIQLTPLQIYCKQFSRIEQDENLQRAYTPLNSPLNQQTSKVHIDLANDNQTKFLRILSDRLTQLAEQQAQYIINSKTSSHSLINDQLINSTILQRRSKLLNNIKLSPRSHRIRSSISESSGYETAEPIESPLLNATIKSTTTHCKTAGMLFNTTGLLISSNEFKNSIKFGPEDILASTNPMLLFSSDESTVSFNNSKRSSRRRRKSNKEVKLSSSLDLESSTEIKLKIIKSKSTALSNVTNTIESSK